MDTNTIAGIDSLIAENFGGIYCATLATIVRDMIEADHARADALADAHAQTKILAHWDNRCASEPMRFHNVDREAWKAMPPEERAECRETAARLLTIQALRAFGRRVI